jgi:hypothetical protein
VEPAPILRSSLRPSRPRSEKIRWSDRRNPRHQSQLPTNSRTRLLSMFLHRLGLAQETSPMAQASSLVSSARTTGRITSSLPMERDFVELMHPSSTSTQSPSHMTQPQLIMLPPCLVTTCMRMVKSFTETTQPRLLTRNLSVSPTRTTNSLV